VSAAAEAVLRLLEELGGAHRPAGQVLCIDGRAGTGKSTLAAEISAAQDRVRTVHTDDVCPGWDGLASVPDLLAAVLEPVAGGRPGEYVRYDWVLEAPGETVVVPPGGLVVVEGLGAGARSLRPWRTALVWLEAPLETRRRRALDRDGDTFAPYWDQWAAAEQSYLDSEADREFADLVLQT
jgi:uridine kinase